MIMWCGPCDFSVSPQVLLVLTLGLWTLGLWTRAWQFCHHLHVSGNKNFAPASSSGSQPRPGSGDTEESRFSFENLHEQVITSAVLHYFYYFCFLLLFLFFTLFDNVRVKTTPSSVHYNGHEKTLFIKEVRTLCFVHKIVVFPCCEDDQWNKAKCP